MGGVGGGGGEKGQNWKLGDVLSIITISTYLGKKITDPNLVSYNSDERNKSIFLTMLGYKMWLRPWKNVINKMDVFVIFRHTAWN
jgi:hypothetical protein